MLKHIFELLPTWPTYILIKDVGCMWLCGIFKLSVHNFQGELYREVHDIKQGTTLALKANGSLNPQPLVTHQVAPFPSLSFYRLCGARQYQSQHSLKLENRRQEFPSFWKPGQQASVVARHLGG